MSSIIACSSPGTSGASGTRCGVLPRSSMPSAWASRLAGSMVRTTTVRPYSAARRAIAAAVVVLPTPPAPQHTTTRLLVSLRIEPMSRAGGAVLIDSSPICVPAGAGSARRADRSSDTLVGKRFGEFVEAAEVDTLRQRGQLQPGHVQPVQLGGALGARPDPGGVLNGLGEQTGEILVGQRDP